MRTFVHCWACGADYEQDVNPRVELTLQIPFCGACGRWNIRISLNYRDLPADRNVHVGLRPAVIPEDYEIDRTEAPC